MKIEMIVNILVLLQSLCNLIEEGGRVKNLETSSEKYFSF